MQAQSVTARHNSAPSSGAGTSPENAYESARHTNSVWMISVRYEFGTQQRATAGNATAKTTAGALPRWHLEQSGREHERVPSSQSRRRGRKSERLQAAKVLPR